MFNHLETKADIAEHVNKASAMKKTKKHLPNNALKTVETTIKAHENELSTIPVKVIPVFNQIIIIIIIIIARFPVFPTISIFR